MIARRNLPTLVALVASVVGVSCTRSIRLEEPDGSFRDGGRAADGGELDATLPAGKCVLSSQVDLLFVMDNSNSMAEEQASLAEQFPLFVQTLVAPPDEDGDGAPDFPPIIDLHVGVVTTDMGTGGYRVPTCLEPSLGDDGVLRTDGNVAAGCAAAYPSFLAHGGPDDDLAAFVRDVSCIIATGTNGCGFEQPLEAALKALTPSSSPIEFVSGTRGHGDGANAGFIRPDSMLGIVIVTDEEDCSVADASLFDPASSTYSGDLNLRCFSYPEAVHPVRRYVDGLGALRRDRPDLLAFAAIAGVPPDLVPGALPTASDYDAILGDSRMREEIDPDAPTRLRRSCDAPGRGFAFPPRRMVEVAAGLEGQSTVASICDADFTAAVHGIATLFGRRACARYVP